MSTLLWPTFPGQTLSVKRTPLWATDVQESRSGKEQRIAYWATPRYRWDLELEFARAGGNTITVYNTGGSAQFTGSEAAALAWFQAQMRGKWDYFYLNDPFAVQPAYYNGGTPVVAPTPTATPTTGTGSIPAGTYYYSVTSVTALGESVQAECTCTLSAIGEITVSWSAVSGALSYNVYGRSTTQGNELFIANTASTSYVDSSTTITPAGPMPQLRVRFDMDDLEMEQLEDYSRVWSTKSITMISVRR
jgi:hypothetical protein